VVVAGDGIRVVGVGVMVAGVVVAGNGVVVVGFGEVVAGVVVKRVVVADVIF